MTVEKLHDAIGLLPADLVAEADAKRNRKPKVVQWKRFLLMAACFALVLSCARFAALVLAPKGSGAPVYEAAMDASPMEQAAMEEPAAAAPAAEAPAAEAAPEEAPNSLSEDAVCGLPTAPAAASLDVQVRTPVKPSTACFSSSARAVVLRSRAELDTYLAEKDWIYDLSSLVTAAEICDKEWFEAHDLLLVALPDIPDHTSPRITSLNDRGDAWEVCIGCDLTEPAEEAVPTAWHCLLELSGDQIQEDETITVIFE